MIALLVVLGAAVGAALRHLTDRALRARLGAGFPWGTLTVNVAGSFVLGLILGAAVPPEIVALVGTGFCGALTTYSTFGLDVVELTGRHRLRAVLYAAASVLGGIGAAVLGFAVVRLG